MTADRTFDSLIYGASLEDSGDNLLTVRKFAHTNNTTANTIQDLWQYGGTKTLLSAASTLSVVSANVNDTVAGTGARYLIIYGLDANYNILNETVTLNGTTPVVTSGSFIAVNNVRVVLCGSGLTNAGNITITAVTGGSVQGYITAGDSIMHASHFTVPAGYTAFVRTSVITGFRESGGTGVRAVEVDQMAFVPAANTTYYTIKYGFRTDAGNLILNPSIPSQTPEKITIWFKVTTDTTNTIVTSSQEILLVKGNLDRQSYF